MSKRYPNLKNNESAFPHVGNVDVFKYDNDLDYARFDYSQMEILVCSVPWDMGEAHIGNRTISGIGNVVYFDSKEARDAWFDAIPDSECFRFSTYLRQLHRDNIIDVPLPFDIASRFNYVEVSYSLVANDDSLLEYESGDGLRHWFWFVREVEFLAPNSTRLHLMADAWQTFIYDIDITGMMLERGHAPMAETSADEYLANPIGKCYGLLAPDESFGSPTVARGSSEAILNGKNMQALVVTSASPSGTWGTKAGGDWACPAAWNVTTDGAPSYFAFAMPAASLSTFLAGIASTYPQFAQTVKCVAFVSADLLDLGTAFTFAGVSCKPVSTSQKELPLLSLDKSLFGFPEEYAGLAKLYTYPYSAIVVTDENGGAQEIRVEDTNGSLSLLATVNAVFPWLRIDAQISGIGSAASSSIKFSNVTERSVDVDGNWYETLRSWSIPTFGIQQSGADHNDYATHYDRAQRVNDYTTAQANENANADTSVANAAIVNAANSSTTAYSNSSANDMAAYAVAYNYASAAASNQYIGANATSTVAANDMQGSVSAGASAASGVTSAIGSAIGGNPLGAAAALVNGVIGAASTMASTTIANGLTYSQSGNAIANNSNQATASNYKTNSDTAVQTSTASSITVVQNDMNTATTANSAATQKANASRNASNSQAAIDNQIAQAGIEAPQEFGSYSDGEHATTRPQGLFANVVTQSAGAIRQAGDTFLRYGYAYNKYWSFDGNWNAMPKFTYWKLSDFWIKGLDVPDMYVDRIRFFLFGGVTVWRDPEDIGNTSIYDNIIE